MSAFYDQPREQGVIRFCFAKKDETLKLALERLARL
jgi:methionine aminotransferase